MFDIFYMGENPKLCEAFPFAQQIIDQNAINSATKMYWFIEPNIEILDFHVFEYRPSDFDHEYAHVWKWDAKNYGGVKLLPKKQAKGTKEVNSVVCKKSFDILLTSTPGEYFEEFPYATHVWCADAEYKLSDNIDWAPDNFEPDFIHCFHLYGQLEYKYPDQEGGIKLFPRHWKSSGLKYHGFLDANIKYPVMYVEDPEDYAQRDIHDADYVWLIDNEYQIQESSIDWVPDPFEDQYIHSFRMPNQLHEKTWSFKHPTSDSRLGGIRLVPKNWRKSFDLIENGIVIHKDCPVEDKNYDVFYTNRKFDATTFAHYAKRSDTDWFWVVDRDYDFNGKLLYIPESHELQYIHVFKWGMEHRYPPEITELWDDRVAGIYLVNKNFDATKQKLHTNIVPVRYDMFFTDNLTDYDTFSRKSKTEAFWLIDSEHVLSDIITWVPEYSDQSYINIFKLPGQLLHKYPVSITNVSDNRCGGIKLVPKDTNCGLKYQGLISDIEITEYEKFTCETSGREKSKHDWFWVIDPDVIPLDDFDFGFIPDTWDHGKTHIWQKLNPVTRKQYDYGGIRLCHKVPQTKGRPKYLREPSCTQRPYPVYYLALSDYDHDLQKAYECFDYMTEVGMYWVVDVNTTTSPDFLFDYYPTQWDQKNIHVFSDDTGQYRNIRLIPTGTFEQDTYTNDQILNNSFEKLKLIDTVASVTPQWPVVYLDSLSVDNFMTAMQSCQSPFLWTVSPDVELQADTITQKFVPQINDISKVHAWQIMNPHTKKLHGYGGLHLWPTSVDYSYLNNKNLRLNSLRNLQHVAAPGSTQKPFDVIFISYHEPNSQQAYDALCSKVEAKWVKDVDGIFQAHKQAASLADSKMFWVVDADAEINENFDFSYMPDVYDEEAVHVWASINPVTGSEYGYGGVKLFNTQQVLEADSWGLDFATGLSSRFKFMSEISCSTNFNIDEYSTWRSAFRECVKLSVGSDPDNNKRLASWLNPLPDAPFNHVAKLGAEHGIAYATMHADNPDKLMLINNYEFLREYYENTQNNS